MPNTKAPRIPTYRLHKPTNLAVVRLHGRDIYLGRYGSAESRQAYERAIAEWLANGRQLTLPMPTRRPTCSACWIGRRSTT